MDEEATHEENEVNELYRDVNINLEGRDTVMTDASLPNVHETQETEDTHVILTALIVPEDVPVTTIVEPPLVFGTTLPPPPTHLITHMQQIPFPIPTTAPSTFLQDLPNFSSLFSAFMMNRLNHPDWLSNLASTCKSLVELEYFFKEVYKATIEQLDWHNPEGQQYPYDLRKPLPLIPNSRGRQVIPFDHFINNNLAYLCGGVSSRTYASWNLLVMYILDVESSLSQSFKLSNGMATNIWIGSPFEEMMTSFTHSRKATSKSLRLRIHQRQPASSCTRQGYNLNVEERLSFSVLCSKCSQNIVIQRLVEEPSIRCREQPKELKITKPDSYRSDLK
ncbi:hypothetical protein Tco_0445545 [Tanacetum coccineum]